MTPLHCAAISHSVTVKALSNCEQADVCLRTKAAEKLSCVQMLLSAGASLLSQVQYSSSYSERHTSKYASMWHNRDVLVDGGSYGIKWS